MHLRGNGPAHRFGILSGVKWALGKFLAQFAKQFLCQWVLLFPASRQCQQNLGVWLQIPSAIDSFSQLLHPQLFVAVDSSKHEKEPRAAGKASDDVIGSSEGDIGVVCVWLLRKQLLGVFVSFLQPFQAFICCFFSIMSAFDSIPAVIVSAKKASESLTFIARRAFASLRAWSSAS